MKILSKGRYSYLTSLSLVLIYLPGVLVPGIWSDDYPTLVDPESHQIHASRDGRPIYGLALEFFFGLIRSGQNLWAIKLLALIGLLLLANLVMRLLNNERDNPRILLSVIGAFSVASFQLSIHWATAFSFTWTAFFALLGFTYIVKNPWKLKFFGICLLTISSLSYPLLVFFVIPVVFLLWFETGRDFMRLRTNLLWALFGIAFSALNALMISRLLLESRELTFNDRVAIISLTDLPSQLFWFLSTPVVLAFRGYSIESPGLLSALLGFILVNSLILIGFYLRFKSLSDTILTWLLLIVFTSFSLVLLFFSDQQQIDMRYVTTGSWLIAYISITSIFQIVSFLRFGRSLIKRDLLTIGLVAVYFLSINFRYFDVIRPIYIGTSSFINVALQSCDQSQIRRGVYVIPRAAGWPNKEYIGMFSQVSDLASPWVPLNAVKVGVENIPELRNTNITISWGDKDSPGCLVDLNSFQSDK
jgi:hypothetical protein